MIHYRKVKKKDKTLTKGFEKATVQTVYCKSNNKSNVTMGVPEVKVREFHKAWTAMKQLATPRHSSTPDFSDSTKMVNNPQISRKQS